MAEQDAEAQLLDGIVGKYGEDCADIENDDEDALLGSDDVEQDNDVLDIVACDGELEDVENDGSFNQATNMQVSSTTQSENLNLEHHSNLDDHERDTDKFKNERLNKTSKVYNIPDSLDEVPVWPLVRNNRNNNRFGGNRGRSNNQNRSDNKTVHINPHFQGQVKINNNAHLAWDARRQINKNKNQIGRVLPFSQPPTNQPTNIQPWITHGGNGMTPNVPQYQPSAPMFQPPQPQVPNWNPFQPNTFNQVSTQMNTHQHVWMQPIPQFPNQFAQPPTQFNPQPVFPNQNMNFPPAIPPNPQFLPQTNQFHQNPQLPINSRFDPPPVFNQPPHNQFMPPQPLHHQEVNRFAVQDHSNNNYFRVQQQKNKQNFNQARNQPYQRGIGKKRIDGNVELRKMKKRVLPSANLHQVPTVEIPDTTTVAEAQEEEDEETKAYRRKIEEQKQLRMKLLAQKEKRRQLAIQQKQQPDNAQQGLKVLHTHQLANIPKQLKPRVNSSATVSKAQQLNNRNIKVINTSTDESDIDKQHLASFLSNRKILTKDQSLVDTNIVIISNLAAGTTEVKLRKMCQGIGDVKKFQMSPKERQATIQFNSVASAHAFFKKYQRTMLDLSMIQVTLKPMP